MSSSSQLREGFETGMCEWGWERKGAGGGLQGWRERGRAGGRVKRAEGSAGGSGEGPTGWGQAQQVGFMLARVAGSGSEGGGRQRGQEKCAGGGVVARLPGGKSSAGPAAAAHAMTDDSSHDHDHGTATTDASPYVTLVSSDGFTYTVSKDAASISGTLRNMISDTFEEGTTNTIRLHDIDAPVLDKVVEYLYYNEKYKDCVDVPDFHVPTEMALELLVAADFLHV